jgi:hypothetical protein
LAAFDEFLRIAIEDVTTEKFDIAKILVDGEDGVVLGEFAHRIHRTDRCSPAVSPCASRSTTD